MLLLSGPFDGAEGTSYWAGSAEVWVRAGDHQSKHRIRVAGKKLHPEHVRYVLTSRCDRGRFIYSYGENSGVLEILTEREAAAA